MSIVVVAPIRYAEAAGGADALRSVLRDPQHTDAASAEEAATCTRVALDFLCLPRTPVSPPPQQQPHQQHRQRPQPPQPPHTDLTRRNLHRHVTATADLRTPPGRAAGVATVEPTPRTPQLQALQTQLSTLGARLGDSRSQQAARARKCGQMSSAAQAAVRAFADADVDGDGGLSAGEVRAGQMLNTSVVPKITPAGIRFLDFDAQLSERHVTRPSAVRTTCKGEGRQARRDDGSDMVQIWRAPGSPRRRMGPPLAHFARRALVVVALQFTRAGFGGLDAFAAADGDGDGAVTWEEFRGQPPPRRRGGGVPGPPHSALQNEVRVQVSIFQHGFRSLPPRGSLRDRMKRKR